MERGAGLGRTCTRAGTRRRRAPSPTSRPTTSGAAGRRADACRCRGGRRPTAPRSATPVVIQTLMSAAGLPRLQALIHRFDHQTAARRGGRSVSLLRHVATAASPTPTRYASVYCQCPGPDQWAAHSVPSPCSPSPCCAPIAPRRAPEPRTAPEAASRWRRALRTISAGLHAASTARTTGLSARMRKLLRIASMSVR